MSQHYTGLTVPDLQLTNLHGESRSIHEYHANQRLVMVLMRGLW
jgi:hypothetical protein